MDGIQKKGIKMKNILKLIFFYSICILLVSCTSSNIKKNPVEIPFTLNEHKLQPQFLYIFLSQLKNISFL